MERLAEQFTTRSDLLQEFYQRSRQFKIRTTAISGGFCIGCLANNREAAAGKGLWRRLEDRSQSVSAMNTA
jgi:hypothetical protein